MAGPGRQFPKSATRGLAALGGETHDTMQVSGSDASHRKSLVGAVAGSWRTWWWALARWQRWLLLRSMAQSPFSRGALKERSQSQLPPGWVVVAGQAHWDLVIAFKGQRSLKLSNAMKSSGAKGIRKITVRDGHSLQFSAHVKGDQIEWDGPQAWLRWRDGNGATQQHRFAKSVRTGAFDWSKLYGKTALPADVAQAEIVVGLPAQATGTVWFDEILVVSEHESCLFMASPPCRAPVRPL